MFCGGPSGLYQKYEWIQMFNSKILHSVLYMAMNNDETYWNLFWRAFTEYMFKSWKNRFYYIWYYDLICSQGGTPLHLEILC
jgi:hypothetical protein